MENKLQFYQKIIPILKAVASGLIWGLGQVFNRQFRKALFFFLFFACLVGIELLTSRYFEPFDAFTNKIDGEMFTDNIVNNKILPYYDDAVNNPDEKDFTASSVPKIRIFRDKRSQSPIRVLMPFGGT